VRDVNECAMDRAWPSFVTSSMTVRIDWAVMMFHLRHKDETTVRSRLQTPVRNYEFRWSIRTPIKAHPIVRNPDSERKHYKGKEAGFTSRTALETKDVD
jgi:hypothetical protein